MTRTHPTYPSAGVAAVTGLLGIVALAPLAGLFGPGAPAPLPALPAASPAALEETARIDAPGGDTVPTTAVDFIGHWQGDLDVAGTSLRLVFHIRAPDGGELTATLDSPDQGTIGIPVESVTVDADSLRLDVFAVAAVYAARLVDGGDALEGEWRQAGQALPLHLERADDGAGDAPGPSGTAKRRPQDPEPPLPYSEQEVHIDVPGAGVTLAGTLTLPPGDGPVPAVVLVSGSGAQDRDGTLAGHRPFLVLADHLTRRGVAVLRTDDRGVGGSGGSTFGSTMDDRARDVLAAVRFLGERPGIDPERIGVLGHSEGGWVVPLAATEAPDEIAFSVLMAGPGQSPQELLLSQQRALLTAQGADDARIAALQAFVSGNLEIIVSSPDTATARERLIERRRTILSELPDAQRSALEAYFDEQSDAARDQALWGANTPWFRDLLAFDAAAALRTMEQPALALLAARDLQVPAEANAPLLSRLLDADARPDREVRVLEGLNHLFQPAETGLPSEYAAVDTTMSAAALEAVGGWIDGTVGR